LVQTFFSTRIWHSDKLLRLHFVSAKKSINSQTTFVVFAQVENEIVPTRKQTRLTDDDDPSNWLQKPNGAAEIE
jgi:hypothetical protein